MNDLEKVSQQINSMRWRQDYGLPDVRLTEIPTSRPLCIVMGTAPGAGRNGYVNFVGSLLQFHRKPFAIVDVGESSGSALRAHRETADTIQIRPLMADGHIALIDAVAERHDRFVLLSVPRDFWQWFSAVELALLAAVMADRPVGYLFVDDTGASVESIDKHVGWLETNGFPRIAHFLTLRELRLGQERRVPAPRHLHIASIPHFEAQVAESMFGRPCIDAPRTFKPFHLAWQAATLGTKAVMLEQVNRAAADFARFIHQTAFNFETLS